MQGKHKRLDYLLVHLGMGSRKFIRKLVKNSEVLVNGVLVKDPSIHIKEEDRITIDGRVIEFKKYYYFMMNKPSGIITATYDKKQKTIIDLLSDIDKNKNLFPVGRLDKDTEGLILLTTDGKLNHELLSPSNEKQKVYHVELDSGLNQQEIDKFQSGIIIDNGYHTLPAKIELLESEKNIYKVIITEGKFHQIKRMFLALNKNVLYLKRVSIHTLELDPNLKLGEYRELNVKEISELKNL